MTVRPHTAEKTKRANSETSEEEGKSDGKRLFPRQFPYELPEIQSQQHIAREAAQIVEYPVGIPAGLSPERILGGIRYS